MSDRERIIEGTWTCTSCDQKGILARHKSCPNCNNPREGGKESEFEYGGTTASGASTQETVTDPKALEVAAAGADWLCNFCGAANRGDKPQCRHCGAKRQGDEKAAEKEALPPAPPRPAPPRPPSRVWQWVAGVAALGGLLGFWATRQHEAGGRVSATAWTRTVHREVFTRVQRQGWLDELRPSRPVMPVNGQGESGGVEDVRACMTRQRGTRQVADGTERVCHDRTRKKQCGTEEKCSVTKLKNGFARESCHDVPKYCDETYQACQDETRYRTEPVYGQRCTYDTWEWKREKDELASGSGDAPRWPTVVPGSLERLTGEEAYTVKVEYERKGTRQSYELRPRSESEFTTWKPGAPVKLKVSNMGSVSEVLPGM